MENTEKIRDMQHHEPDVRDRLIVALYAQLKAERETREAMEWVARQGGLSPDVLEAMSSDPVPVFSPDDLVAVERIIDGERSAEEERKER